MNSITLKAKAKVRHNFLAGIVTKGHVRAHAVAFSLSRKVIEDAWQYNCFPPSHTT